VNVAIAFDGVGVNWYGRGHFAVRKFSAENSRVSVAVITGAGQGIGRAIAIAFSQRDMCVVVADIDGLNASNVKTEIENLGEKALAIDLDVSSEASVTRMIECTMEEFGTIDVLVNNAGVYPTSSIEELTNHLWDRVIGTNLTGAFLCSRAAVPIMLEKKRGRIINVSSSTAFRGAKNGAHYAASKAGIIGFTKALALELAPTGITVNAICPGLTDTAQPRGHMTEAELYSKKERIPLGRIAQPEDIVGTALFLASDKASQITGQTVFINGGDLMW
jgi:NAD(P)-dependent dehydrogenase (short-subunit alcohol dehydrogenase family)